MLCLTRSMNGTYHDKLQQVILYVLNHPDYREGGIKKLNKLLYFIDFYFYRDHEKLITGAKYAKAPMGPLIDRYQQIFSELEQAGVLVGKIVDGRNIYLPLVKCDVESLSSIEVDHISQVLGRYGKLRSSELEAISHGQQPWVLTENYGDIIDPDLALLMSDESSEDSEREITDPQLRDELIALARSV